METLFVNRNKSDSLEDRIVVYDSQDKPLYKTEEIRDKIILGDTLDVLRKIESNVFDTVFIDPPYFLQLKKKKLRRWDVKTDVEGVFDEWDKFSSFEEYDDFIQSILSEVKRVMKENATIWVIGTYHNIFRIGKLMQDLGFWILNDVIWVKNNPMPNWLGVRFTNATETLIWAVKDKKVKKYTFNKDLAKQFGIGKIGANVWQIPVCSGKERIKDKDGNKIHSTQKPIELLKRVILTTTKEGDLILDPMAGTGTSGYVAKILKRDFTMIERQPEYVEAMVKRLTKQYI
jgi:DNA modification methylase